MTITFNEIFDTSTENVSQYTRYSILFSAVLRCKIQLYLRYVIKILVSKILPIPVHTPDRPVPLPSYPLSKGTHRFSIISVLSLYTPALSATFSSDGYRLYKTDRVLVRDFLSDFDTCVGCNLI